MTNITKANVSKFGRNQEGVYLDAAVIAEKFIGKTYTERHVKRVNLCLAAIRRGIVNKAKFMDKVAS
jgi:hypothetical protein